MSKLLQLIKNNQKLQFTNQLARVLNNKIISFKPTQRFLASAVKQHTEAPKPASSTEKQQWERDDRFKIFYGFNDKDEAADKATAHFFTFCAFLGLFFVPGLVLYYYPDYKTNDWCYREAHLEIARREKAGEPLVNPDYIPPEKIKLPSDEEIGDMEIII